MMKRKKQLRKNTRSNHVVKYVFASMVLLVGVVLVMQQAYAAAKATDEAVNEFRLSNFQTTITENFTPPETLKVNEPVEKEVLIQNTCAQAAFIRVMVIPVISAKEAGESLLLPAAYQGADAQLLIPFNTTDWVDGKDGYFYYTKKLGKEQETAYLFKQVTLNPATIDARYHNAEVLIEIKVEGISATAYAYRDAWWGGTVPANEPLKGLDDQLKPFAQ